MFLPLFLVLVLIVIHYFDILLFFRYCVDPILTALISLGTKYSGIRFRRALLDTIPHIGEGPFFSYFHPLLCPRARA